MKKLNKSQKRMLVILTLVVAYAAYDLVQNLDEYKGVYGGSSGEEETSEQTPEDSSGYLASLPALPEYKADWVYEAGWRRDPFNIRQEVAVRKPAVKPVEKTVQLTLDGISLGDASLAIINGKIVGVGETIAGYTVSEIKTESVVLKKRLEERVLLLQ